MKLISFRYENLENAGVLSRCEKKVYPFKDLGADFTRMNDFIDATSINATLLKNVACMAADFDKNENVGISLENIDLLAPIPNPKQDIICLGINYADHAEESAKFKKEEFAIERSHAIYFSKRVNEAVAHNGYIPLDENIITALDYEVELAVVIGKDAKNVAPENVFDYILGYTIMNDITDRNVQMRHKQWYFGKSLDGFTPLGPCIVTEDEFNRPPILDIKAYVNGELRQNSSTKFLLSDLPHIISELSSGMTLKAGSIIATGTPSGVGMGFQPPRFLKSGDVITCEIEKIGILENTIK